MNDSKDYMKLYMREYRKSHPKIVKKAQRNWRDKNQNYPINYYYRTKDKRIKSVKKYQAKHRQKILNYSRRWRKENSEHSKIYKRQRRKKDINFRLLECLRVRIYSVLKGNNKSATTMKLIGCSIQKLKEHLKKQFKIGMTWQNYGKWHIDHIKSCCTFDLSKISEQKICFNYTNLQPLWAIENYRKLKGSMA